VYAHPDDDEPRLVYADFVTEKGDPRGEFIVLQIEASRRTLTPEEQRWEAMLLQPSRRVARADRAGGVGRVSAPLRARVRRLVPCVDGRAAVACSASRVVDGARARRKDRQSRDLRAATVELHPRERHA
jgi:uncharacterized protein (TIGR02996 family)